MTPEMKSSIYTQREAVGRLFAAVAELQREKIEVRLAAWRVRSALRSLAERSGP